MLSAVILEILMSNLTEEQRQHIIALLDRDENLPTEFKTLLFPLERQEYELVYAGKEREEDIISETMAVPLQPIRTFGGNGVDWHNMLIFGDNLQAMKTLLQMKERGQLVNADGISGIKLIYIDPPFATKREFQGSQEERAYQDKIAGAEFVEFLRKRLMFMKNLLSDDGSIYVHLDWRKCHYIKVVLDELFGENNFRNEVIWHYRRWSAGSDQFQRQHEVLLLYSKGQNPVFNVMYEPYTEGTLRRWKGIKRKTSINESGKLIQVEDTEGHQGANMGDVWPISIINANANERTGFPTQKPEELLDRVIKASSMPGDLVADFFCGSGTTVAMAEKLGRKWIGVDCSKLAIYTTQKRLLHLKSDIGNKGKALKPKSFTLYNAGLYDFAQLRNMPWDGWRSYALNLFECKDALHKISGIELDGFRGNDDVLVFNHRLGGGVVLDYGFIDELHSKLRNKVGARFFIIAPAASVNFLEDYVEKGRTRYYILRIPYSIINELHRRDFTALVQPVDETEVNATVEAVGFDFVRQPKVECSYSIRKPKGELFKNAVVKIKTFQSRAMAKGASQKENLETLSMVLVDYDYPHDAARKGKESPPPFEVDDAFYASGIQAAGWEVRLPIELLGKSVMLVYVDIYGNEYTEIKTSSDFGGANHA